MAGLNVAEWTPDQVADWLTGLGPTVAQYVPGFRARELNGHKLLMLRCDDLEYLGMHIIGHQELLLEAVEHLRNFQYELSRECIQQLALKVSVVATTLARQLRHHTDARLETQILADVARVVHAVKPLVCWLDRWPACSGGTGAGAGAGAGLSERKAALLKLSLEAATCAQRDRFAEQPARAVAAAAATTAAAADYIVQEVCDPLILTPASLDAVCVRQRGKALGFDVVPSYCGHHQLADIRFGSPAHASGAVHAGDEIVQVGGQCVIGWSGAAVREACAAASSGELSLRLRRRGARPPALAPHAPHAPSRALYVPMRIDRYRTGSIMSAEVKEESKEAQESAASSSDDSEALSPPASPTHLQMDHTRMYPPKPPGVVARRHSVSCGSPRNKRHNHTIEQFWQQLKEHRRGDACGSAGVSPEPGDVALYARDKAVSYSTGLETTRPRTCLGLSSAARSPPPPGPGPAAPASSPAACPPSPCPPSPSHGCGGGGREEEERMRGKLDKSHSTPAYDLHPPIPESPHPVEQPAAAAAAAAASDQPMLVVHSAEKADQILEFLKSSSQIGEAMQHRRGASDTAVSDIDLEATGVRDESTTEKILETINIAMMEHRRRSLLEGRPAPAPACASASDPQPQIMSASDCSGRDDDDRGLRNGSPSPCSPSVPPACIPGVEGLGVLRAVPRAAAAPHRPQPHRHIDANQISVPLRHITKHDIRMIPSELRRDLPAINADPHAPSTPTGTPAGDIVVGAHADTKGALSPTSAVRGIFPTSKSRSLKKKSSILAKRRCIPARALAARGAAGGVWQRVRARHHAAQPRWTRRHLLLAHNLLYAYRTPESSRADCMIYLEGFTVCAAGEVKSRANAFKVYHTGTAFYFACDTRDAMLAWIQLIHRATLLPSLLSHVDSSNHFSETDYSETESDNESPEKRSERERDRDKDKDKDKSKFGSLKKLTGRMQRSESNENVSHAATSLDRKYLRFFSRNKSKDDTKPKNKQSGVPVPTEHYRSYRRVQHDSPSPSPSPATSPLSASASTPSPLEPELRASRKIPKPINYIHASNPNLLDFEKSDFVTKPALQPPKPKVSKVQEQAVGLVTLEQFMLQKQAEERRQLALYSDRVLLGVQTHRHTIVADVIYGEVGAPQGSGKPISVKGKDGYEKIVYPDESPSEASRLGYESLPESPLAASPPAAAPASTPAPAPAPRTAPPPLPTPHPALQSERWRDSLRRNDKVHNTRTDSSPASKSSSQHSQNYAASNDSWNNNSSESTPGSGGVSGSGVSGSGVSGPGVSRLRLMFGGRTHHTQCAAPPPTACVPPPPGGRVQYPHLQCPPLFHAETYSLARPAPPAQTPPTPPHVPHVPHAARGRRDV